MKSRICSFIKQETILVVSFVLALISCFFVRPDRGYLGYLSSNIGTIILLFCLMAVVAGLSSLGVFRYVGERLLERVSSQRGIAWMLIFLCFFASMFITNDVALITFVPFAIMILEIAGMQNRIVYTVTLMTIGANLGSMLTPMGNPQNLYLYSLSSMELSDFLKLMLPYTAVSAAGLWLCSVIGFPRGRANVSITKKTAPPNIRGTAYYLFLFLICMLTVSGLLPAPVLLLIITAGVAIKDRRLFQSVDYSLLATFLFFFIFIGNMNRFPPFRDLAVTMITGHEKAAAIAMSQVISNVPAALLLSSFTEKWELLIIGTNLGGLGTLIASMASLISYKQVALRYPKEKGRYLGVFTLWNIIFLLALTAVSALLTEIPILAIQ